MRRALGILGTLLAVGSLWVALGGAGDGKHPNRYWVELDNAFGLIQGGDLKIAGVRAGKLTELKLDRKTNRALVGIEVTQTGFGDLRADTHCDVRPQSLIGEYFVDCQPGTSPRRLRPGAVIPVSHTSSTVAPDLVNNVLRKPFRERFSIIVNELGAAVAGNGQNLNDAIRRASPALRETDRVLGILATQNKVLGNLVKNGDQVIGDLAGNKRNVQRWIGEARDTAKASAERQQQLAAGFRKLPGFLEQLRPTMAALGAAADQQTPALQKLSASSGQLEHFFKNLGPFAKASRPAFHALGDASRTGDRAVKAAGPVVSQLNTFSSGTPELGKNLAIILEHLDNRDHAVEADPRSPGGKGYTGLEALLEYVYDQVMSVNVYDANVHVLKVALQGGGDCADYASIKEAKKFGEECGAALGPKLAGLTDEDTTRPADARDDDGTAPSRRQHFEGGPDPHAPVTAPAPPTDVSDGVGGAPSIPVPAPAAPAPAPGPIQIPKLLPGNSDRPLVPRIGGTGLAAKPAAADDTRTRAALLDYLLGR
jgi:virulence factor Mce-like protein